MQSVPFAWLGVRGLLQVAQPDAAIIGVAVEPVPLERNVGRAQRRENPWQSPHGRNRSPQLVAEHRYQSHRRSPSWRDAPVR